MMWFAETGYLVEIVGAALLIFGLRLLGRPQTAQHGNYASAFGMALALVATIMIVGFRHFPYVAGVVALGAVIGTYLARSVQMTAMPQLVALFNGFGGIGSALVVAAQTPEGVGQRVAFVIALAIGVMTFSGSTIAFLKLAEKMDTRASVFTGARELEIGLGAAVILTAIIFAFGGSLEVAIALGIAAFALGVIAVRAIGGADMPVVIAILNSFSGIAACAAGFVVDRTVVIVAGALVGASGLILTLAMCKGMNRTIAHVLFSSFQRQDEGVAGVVGTASPLSVGDAWALLDAANSVVFVPGYGMAVAQAQTAIRELSDALTDQGKTVRFAIHPVAGRMPGHMNVLLAEANVSYDALVEPDSINASMEQVDVVVVVGANDVVNPDARRPTSPLAGMPVIEADRARAVIVMKRSMASGFAGIDNPLFFLPQTRMLFGDAKSSITQLVAEFNRE